MLIEEVFLVISFRLVFSILISFNFCELYLDYDEFSREANVTLDCYLTLVGDFMPLTGTLMFVNEEERVYCAKGIFVQVLG